MYAFLAITNNSRTILPPSPMYFCTKTLPPNLLNLQYVGELLHALIGEPYNKTPLSRRYWELRRALGASREARGLPLSMWSVCPVHQPSHKCYRVLSRPSLRKPVGRLCWEELCAMCKSQSVGRLGLLLSMRWHQFLDPRRRLSRKMIRRIQLEFQLHPLYLPSGWTLTKTLVFPITFTTSPT